jgi:predicted outer membrane repeat protein
VGNVNLVMRRLRRVIGWLVAIVVVSAALILGVHAANASSLTFPGCGATIQTCINTATNGDTISILAGTYTETINLNKPVSLIGANAKTTILVAPPNERVLLIQGSNITASTIISGLSITHGDAVLGNGGGIIVYTDTYPLLHSLIITGNRAKFAGGGLYSYADITLVNVQVLSNTATNGGGVASTKQVQLIGNLISGNSAVTVTSQINGMGGGVYVVFSDIILTDTLILTNTASATGGGLYSFQYITITNSIVAGNTSFYLNEASAGGGGFFAHSAYLVNVQVISNTATYVGGGAAVWKTIHVIGGRLERNYSGNTGGAINASAAYVTDTIFVSNNSQQNGAAINSSLAHISNTSFISNSAQQGGGAVAAGTLIVQGGSFEGNRTRNNRGGAANAYYMDVRGTVFTNNYADVAGGALANINPSDWIVLERVTFIGNVTGYGKQGGAIYTIGALTITQSSFISNTAPNSSGGAISMGGNKNLLIINSLFASNKSNLGSALYLGNAGQTRILHTTLADNVANPSAVIYSITGTLGITDSIIASHSIGIVKTNGTAWQDYNLFYGVTTPISGTVNGGANNASGNPNFISPADGNYHLQPLSAAIDQGVDVGVATDFDGDTRPALNGFDIGYDESTVVLTPRIYLAAVLR